MQQLAEAVYDGLDEPTSVYTGYDPSNSTVAYMAAQSVSGDIILTQSDDTFDPAGNDLFDASCDRLPDD